MTVHIAAEALDLGFQVRIDYGQVTIEPDTRTGRQHHVTRAGQLAVLDAVHTYHDNLTAEQLAKIPTDPDHRRALVHVDATGAHAAIVPFDGEQLARTFAEILRSDGMTAEVE